MASNKTGMTRPERTSQSEIGGTLIKMLAVGVAGSAALIAGAKVLGEKILDVQVKKYEQLEQQREADKEEVRRIMMAEEQQDESD